MSDAMKSVTLKMDFATSPFTHPSEACIIGNCPGGESEATLAEQSLVSLVVLHQFGKDNWICALLFETIIIARYQVIHVNEICKLSRNDSIPKILIIFSSFIFDSPFSFLNDSLLTFCNFLLF